MSEEKKVSRFVWLRNEAEKDGLRLVTAQFLEKDYPRLVREVRDLRTEVMELRQEKFGAAFGRSSEVSL